MWPEMEQVGDEEGLVNLSLFSLEEKNFREAVLRYIK